VLFHRGLPLPGYEVIHRLSGVAFAACGLIAWRRRPDGAVGRLLTVAGFGVLLGPILEQVDSRWRSRSPRWSASCGSSSTSR